MNKLRLELNKLLKTIHPNITIDGKSKSRVHFQVAADDTPFPYIVYNLPNSLTNEEQEILVLDVDIWDRPEYGDTTVIETLANTVWKALNRYRHIDNDIQFSIYRDRRLPLTDDDVRIKRRKLIFQIRYYDRKVNS